MRIKATLWRIATVALASLVCFGLSFKVPPWIALGLWVNDVIIVCGVTAYILHRQPIGKVTFINRFAPYVLLWGFKIGRGKILPIFIESSLRWLLLGCAVILIISHPGHRTALMSTLLLISWLIDGAAALQLITILVTRARTSPMPRGLLLHLILFISVIAASAALTAFATTPMLATLALLLTTGPIVLLGGTYGLWILFIVTVGRNTRWN